MELQALDDVIETLTKALQITQYKVHSDKKSFGKNFFGILTGLRVEGVKRNEAVRYEVIVKLPPDNEKFREDGFIETMYKNEIFIYNKVLPAYEMVYDGVLLVFPKCYYVREKIPEEVLVIQDMTSEGYRVKPEMSLDIQHGMLVVESIAIFHAMSLAIQETNSDLYDTFMEKFVSVNYNFKVANVYAKVLKNSLQCVLPEFCGETRRILEKLFANFDYYMENLTKCENNLIIHGDMWANNILFKYENGQPTSVCLVDFQTSHYGPATRDLLYFLATSVEPDTRREHFQHFVSRYHNSLNTHLKQFNSNHKEVPVESIVNDIKATAPSVLIMAVITYKNWLEIFHVNDNVFEVEKSVNLDAAIARYRSIIEQLIGDFNHMHLI